MNRSSMRLAAALLSVFWVPFRSHSQPCALDANFTSGLSPGAIVYAVTMQTNGQILVGGIFQAVSGMDRFNVARLNPDGSLDESFDLGNVADNGYVAAITVQHDGKVLVGGAFGSSSGTGTPYLTRLNSNGTVDDTFNQQLTINDAVSSIVLLPDGKIVIAGNFNIVNNYLRNVVARLHGNGTLDTNFDACVASGEGATSLTLLPSGKLLMTGNFSFQSGATRNGIARLGSNGDLDPTYADNSGADGVVYTLAIRTNGNVIIGGNFSTFDSLTRRGVAELDSNGHVDAAFDPEGGINDKAAVFTMMLQADGKLLIGGSFTSFNDVASPRIARLNTDGSLAECDVGFGANDSVSSFVKQAGGKIVISGLFNAFNDSDRNAIARIKGELPPSRLGPPSRRPDGRYEIALHGENQVHYRVEASSNLLNWISITNFTAINQPTIVIDPDGRPFRTRFYRALSLP